MGTVLHESVTVWTWENLQVASMNSSRCGTVCYVLPNQCAKAVGRNKDLAKERLQYRSCGARTTNLAECADFW